MANIFSNLPYSIPLWKNMQQEKLYTYTIHVRQLEDQEGKLEKKLLNTSSGFIQVTHMREYYLIVYDMFFVMTHG